MEPVSKTPTKPQDYAALSATYSALAGGLLLAARDKGEHPVRQAELPTLGLATFALTKLITKEKVETWMREPFLEETPDGQRRPKGRRMRYAVGELLSCSRCMGAWTSLGIVGLRVLRPREARVVTTVLATSAVNDWLQTGFTKLCATANVAQQEADAPPPEAGDGKVVVEGRFSREADRG
ncbi:DUF1360 domain-containing protein [Conexibacter sp. SYSU D00693]|uniref:DUF1360 domain-containing protein n=1 Tax=Conexibacter sp. SYSU D00693 TaxID=2812560 RepID=UPI00196A34BD|nr:DUF1360 domain-containing protein [Conexibacter sp. SYSU D00693]